MNDGFQALDKKRLKILYNMVISTGRINCKYEFYLIPLVRRNSVTNEWFVDCYFFNKNASASRFVMHKNHRWSLEKRNRFIQALKRARSSDFLLEQLELDLMEHMEWAGYYNGYREDDLCLTFRVIYWLFTKGKQELLIKAGLPRIGCNYERLRIQKNEEATSIPKIFGMSLDVLRVLDQADFSCMLVSSRKGFEEKARIINKYYGLIHAYPNVNRIQLQYLEAFEEGILGKNISKKLYERLGREVNATLIYEYRNAHEWVRKLNLSSEVINIEKVPPKEIDATNYVLEQAHKYVIGAPKDGTMTYNQLVQMRAENYSMYCAQVNENINIRPPKDMEEIVKLALTARFCVLSEYIEKYAVDMDIILLLICDADNKPYGLMEINKAENYVVQARKKFNMIVAPYTMRGLVKYCELKGIEINPLQLLRESTGYVANQDKMEYQKYAHELKLE